MLMFVHCLLIFDTTHFWIIVVNLNWKTEAGFGSLQVLRLTSGEELYHVVSKYEIQIICAVLSYRSVPIVKEQYLLDCLEKKEKLSTDSYKLELGLKPAIVKVKVKGRGAVHEDSGLQDTGHIVEEGKTIFATTLNRSELATGINRCCKLQAMSSQFEYKLYEDGSRVIVQHRLSSCLESLRPFINLSSNNPLVCSFYVLQLIEEDAKKTVHHLYRKWGRVGNDRIGGDKIEKLSKAKGIEEFKRLFKEKTGNEWESWVNRENFEKQPGKFYPLDIV